MENFQLKIVLENFVNYPKVRPGPIVDKLDITQSANVLTTHKRPMLNTF